MNLEGKTALVTGASRGIGRVIALRLAGAGARVVVNYHTHGDDAAQVVKEIQGRGSSAIALGANVAKLEEVKALVRDATEAWGRLDILVNNAGIIRDALLMRMSDEAWDEVMDIDLRGAFYCTREAIRAMIRQRWGRVVNISSAIALTGNVGQTNYAAAKAGLLGFTRALAREVATRSITVNAVLPGYIATDIVADLSKQTKDLILSHIPMERFGVPEDVAGLVTFLCTEEASYITGQGLCVDGGITL
ncbi:MAG: 3-oxoacyl-[acyl-carrier-protein] reductase [Dehalococcoidia bacterium]